MEIRVSTDIFLKGVEIGKEVYIRRFADARYKFETVNVGQTCLYFDKGGIKKFAEKILEIYDVTEPE